MGVNFATSAAVPVTPPKTKLLGNLKKYTPTDMMEILSVIIPYCLTYLMTFSRIVVSATVSITLFPFTAARQELFSSAAQTPRQKYFNTEPSPVKSQIRVRGRPGRIPALPTKFRGDF